MNSTPKILTPAEVLEVHPLTDYLWLETREEPDVLYHLQVYCFVYDNPFSYFATCVCVHFNLPDDTSWFMMEAYGAEWRCWSDRPTDEQRGAVEWDER